MPLTRRALRKPAYILMLVILACLHGAKTQMVREDGTSTALDEMARRAMANSRRLLFIQPLLALVIIARSPLYCIRQVGRNFALARDGRDPIVGSGRGKGAGGLVYWYTLTLKARRFGLLGLAHDSYMGMPLSIHSWPLAIVLLQQLRFRAYALVSAGLLAAALVWSAIVNAQTWALLLVPLLLSSTWFVFNVYVGTWEVLAWGLGGAALAAQLVGHPVYAGVLLALVVLAHPGVAALVGVSIAAYGITSSDWFYSTAVPLILGLIGSAWFVIPYLRCRRKMGRGKVINFETHPLGVRWPPYAVYQLAGYSLFVAAMVSTADLAVGEFLLLALPLFVLIIDRQLYWYFSQYTLMNYMLVVGALILCSGLTLLPAVVFVFMINSSPVVLFSADLHSARNFDLTPVRLHGADEVRELFGGTSDGRIAFESQGMLNKFRSEIAALTFMLAEDEVDLLNTSYAELGDPVIYSQLVAAIDMRSEESALEVACRRAGVRYFAALTQESADAARARRYRERGRVSGLRLSPYPTGEETTVVLFELPWDVCITSPSAPCKVGRNEVVLNAVSGVRYVVALTALPGWRAFQNERPIQLMDAEPGISLTPSADGQVELRYRYRYYFMPTVH